MHNEKAKEHLRNIVAGVTRQRQRWKQNNAVAIAAANNDGSEAAGDLGFDGANVDRVLQSEQVQENEQEQETEQEQEQEKEEEKMEEIIEESAAVVKYFETMKRKLHGSWMILPSRTGYPFTECKHLRCITLE